MKTKTRRKERKARPLVSLGEILEASLPREELAAQKLVLQADIIAIDNQLHAADKRAKAGKPSDAKWLKNAQFAMKRKSEDLDRISTILRERIDAQRHEERTSIERCFMVIALEELGKEQFQTMYRRAKEAAHEQD